MFTGIIRHSGGLIKRASGSFVFSVPSALAKQLKRGDSIAVNGTCLTLEAQSSKLKAKVSVMPETLRVTTLGKLPMGSRLNLELPLTLADRLDGHLVAGHVDGVGVIKKIDRRGNSRVLTISLPSPIARLVAPKGSIAVDGVSITVISVTKHTFSIGVIPETSRRTTLGALNAGDRVNLEADLIARYLQKLLPLARGGWEGSTGIH